MAGHLEAKDFADFFDNFVEKIENLSLGRGLTMEEVMEDFNDYFKAHVVMIREVYEANKGD